MSMLRSSASFSRGPCIPRAWGRGAQGLGRAVVLRAPALGRVSAFSWAANRSFKSSVEGCGALREASMGS